MKTALRRHRLTKMARMAAHQDLAQNGFKYGRGDQYTKDGEELTRFFELMRFFKFQALLVNEPPLVDETAEYEHAARLLIRIETMSRQVEILQRLNNKLIGGAGHYFRVDYTSRIEQMSRTISDLARQAKPFVDKLAGVNL